MVATTKNIRRLDKFSMAQAGITGSVMLESGETEKLFKKKSRKDRILDYYGIKEKQLVDIGYHKKYGLSNEDSNYIVERAKINNYMLKDSTDQIMNLELQEKNLLRAIGTQAEKIAGKWEEQARERNEQEVNLGVRKMIDNLIKQGIDVKNIDVEKLKVDVKKDIASEKEKQLGKFNPVVNIQVNKSDVLVLREEREKLEDEKKRFEEEKRIYELRKQNIEKLEKAEDEETKEEVLPTKEEIDIKNDTEELKKKLKAEKKRLKIEE